ncbi:Holliday junction resolvase RuvX [Aggregatilinea lenta]|uniref:Holliday junction resolvase RuvX n=1 Tax=Aggregatilinea lenta TaxID=913108 RepID=UPI0013C2E4C2|nr:Holliday junction resolvase RuvX [Aggregatilinea lenta]
MDNFPGRLIGVDYGLKVVGLAICDPTGLLSRPLQLLYRRSKVEDFAVIGQLVAEHSAAGLVVGLPESPPEITVYTHADRVRLWASRLAAAVSVPVYLFDERYSSQEAEDILRDEGRDLPERIDAVAAAIILQGFLDARREGLPWPEPVEPAEEQSRD